MPVPGDTAYYRNDRSDFLDWVGGSHARVLDVGCGAGANARWYRRNGAREIVGVELDPASASEASAVFDQVICGQIEAEVGRLSGAFDLIVCADVLEHLVDPWSVTQRLSDLAQPSTVLAVSIPNIRFLGALSRIAVGSGFEYESEGIFDATHLRFFTRRNVGSLLTRGGWAPQRWGAQHYGRLRPVRRAAGRVSRGLTDDWLAEQIFVSARLARAGDPPNERAAHPAKISSGR